ncbi:MAG: 3'-5' exonuclease [Bacteroidales bacterium]|nr:3'-5' exonuclease [Bacteroidales bacterium]
MVLDLKRPIIVFDIESTGLSIAEDRIVEISVIKVHPDGSREHKTRRVNPEIPISEESREIHGISNEDVKDCPTFKQIAKSLAEWMSGCDIAGFNSLKFDIPMLAEEFLRAGVEFNFRDSLMVDVQNIFHKMEPRTLVAAYRFYCNKELDKAHSAEGDTLATLEVLEAQVQKYPELKNDVEFLASFSERANIVDFAGRIARNSEDEPIFNFGKHKGKRVIDVFKKEPSYYDWMMKGEFARDTKQVITDIWMKYKESELKDLFNTR